MAETRNIRFGRTRTTFFRSDDTLALKPQAGADGRVSTPVGDILASVAPDAVQEKIGDYQIVESDAAQAAIQQESGRSGVPAERPVNVYHTSDDKVPFVPEGTLFLAFNDGVSSDDIQRILTRHELSIREGAREGFVTVETPQFERDAVEVAADLQGEDAIALAEPDLTTPRDLLNVVPDDALLAKQWHLRNTGPSFGYKAGADARVVDAWNRLGNLGSSDPILAVIDDGFQLSHPDLPDRAEHPFDFIRQSTDVHPEPNLENQLAGDWHGTACAGVALARAGHGKVVGAAPNARLMPLRMTRDLSAVQVEQWMRYATDKGAWIISCSWRAKPKIYPLPERIYQAISRAATKGRSNLGSVVVFAAGNSNGVDINEPGVSVNGYAIHPDVLAVAASNSMDQKAAYSDIGKDIAVCAPSGGVWDITTTDVSGEYTDANGATQQMGYVSGAYSDRFTGTSSACPLVAGVCALVMGANPDLTAADVREIIRATARKIGDPADYVDGHSRAFGHGCVDADTAVARAVELKTDPNLLIALRADAAARVA